MPRTSKIPNGFSKDAQAAIKVIISVVGKSHFDERVLEWSFKTPEEWKGRGEKYGTESVLVVMHDGPPLNTYFNLDYCADAHIEKLWKALGKIGMRAEQCTSWYSAIYRD